MCCASLLETVTEKSATAQGQRPPRHHREWPALAAHALRAGLVDEIQMFICPAVVVARKRFFPDRVRLKLELVDEHRFRNGVVFLRYVVRG